MRSHKLASILILLAVIGLFFAGVVYFFALRFGAGDIYPPYSSYRSDPMGTRALFEGLGRLSGVESVRNTNPLWTQPQINETTLLIIGVERKALGSMGLSLVEAIEKAAQEGGRIVLALAPEKGVPLQQGSASSEKEGNGRDVNQTEKGPAKAGIPGEYIDLRSRWHVDLGVLPEQNGQARLRMGETDLPPLVDWHSAVAFEAKDGDWRTVYSREDAPVVVERTMGAGTVILLSDPFLLTNQAMKEHRYPGLLVWLCGSHKRIVFDETHFGISGSSGIAALLRKEGLTPLFISLVLLVLLAVWRQSAPFVPPTDQPESEAAEQGRTYRTGMANVLRQNIRPADLLAACLDEWERSFTRGPGSLASLKPEIENTIKEEREQHKKMRSPEHGYNKISALVVARRRGAREGAGRYRP